MDVNNAVASNQPIRVQSTVVAAPRTPNTKAKPKPRPAYRKAQTQKTQDTMEEDAASPSQPGQSDAGADRRSSPSGTEPDEDVGPSQRSTSMNGFHTPSTRRTQSQASPTKSSARSRKRARSPGDEGEDEHEVDREESPSVRLEEPAAVVSPSPTQGEEFIVRKKRIRH